MTTYYCKCGRQVKKSSNADNTGNRDTADCTGCPYLLPWGPFVWDEVQKAFTQDSKGQECRMSREIRYDTTYQGGAKDKNTMSIASLDLDFLDEVQAWIIDQYPHEILHAEFSRGSIRGTDYSRQGRYRMPIYCAANKKGMAAKAALIEHFFTPQGTRKGVTPAQEQRLVLDAIEKGKAREKENTMKKQNDRCPLQQECERTCKVIGHERDCDYYVNNRYCTEGIPDQDELLAEEEIRQEREWEEQYLASLSDKPSDPITYQNEYGTLFAVREHKGAPALMCKAKEADSWALSGVLAAVRGEAYTSADLQEVLDEYARAHGWKKAASEQTKEDYSPCEGCRCPACDDPDCTQAHCDKSDKGFGCIASGEDCPPENPTAAAPASPADAGAATQSLSAAGPASLEAKDMNVSAFDYSGLDLPTRDTLHWAEKEIGEARREYIARLAQAVSIAHDALCATVVQNLDNGKFTKSEESFQRWCESVGIKRSTAYNLLQVQALLSGSTPEEQATLEAASPSLLYAAAKPSAPAELVQSVKDGDITTHKQYQEALAEIRARDAKITDLLEMSEAADRRADKAEQAAKDTARERDTALRRAAEAENRATAAENRAAGAQKLADQRGTENTDLRRKLKEAESRPIDIAVAEPSEADKERWRKEGEDRMAATLQDTVLKAHKAKITAETQVADLQDENERLRIALDRPGQLDASAAMACGACSAALGAWFESTARDVPADLGPALTRMKRLRLALDIAIENGVWPDDNVLDDLGGEAL